VLSIDPIIELALARQRQSELDRRLELLRLLRQTTEPQPALTNRALITLGDALVDLGLRLRERYAAEPMPSAR
jgi:hypothetical protein